MAQLVACLTVSRCVVSVLKTVKVVNSSDAQRLYCVITSHFP